MTTTVQQPATERRRRLSWLPWLLIPLGAVLLLTVVALAFGQRANAERLHPRNPGDDGTMALAEVLSDRGVEVRRVDRHRNLINAAPTQQDTVVITDTSALDDGVARRIVPYLQDAGRVVVSANDHQRLIDLGLPVTTQGWSDSPMVPADCPDDVVPTRAMSADFGRMLTSTDTGWTGCFAGDRGHGLVYGPYGDTTAVVVGSLEFATNGRILEHDNAQLAVWLYGSSSRVIWYQPDYNDTVDDPAEDDEPGIAPEWFGPLLGLLTVTVIVAMIAAGRRFGPLSTEPLPVIVSALETTRTRGRLYRGADDLRHSAAVLRSASVRRIAARFGLSGSGSTDEVTQRVCAVLADRHPRAREVLLGPLPDAAEDAVHWLQDLRELEAVATHEGTTDD